VNPALRIFKVPPTDISINAYRMVTIQPTTTGINPMEFIVPGWTILWIWDAVTLHGIELEKGGCRELGG